MTHVNPVQMSKAYMIVPGLLLRSGIFNNEVFATAEFLREGEILCDLTEEGRGLSKQTPGHGIDDLNLLRLRYPLARMLLKLLYRSI